MRISRLLKWIGITVAVCVLILFIKNEYTYLLLQDANYGIPALIKQGSVDNLYLGSSMFRQGLDIEMLNENGESNYILSYNGNQPYLEYIILKKLIDNGVQIKNLYVDMYAYSAIAEPDLSDEKIFLELSLSEKWTLFETLCLSPNYKSLSSRIKMLWQMFVTSNNDTLLTWPISSSIINSQFLSGGSLGFSEGMKDDTEYVLPDKINDGIENEGTLNSFQMTELDKLVTLAKQKDINICFVETPKTPLARGNMIYINSMKEFTSFCLDRNVSTILMCEDDIINKYDISYFADVLHLSTKGRIEFSQYLLNYK